MLGFDIKTELEGSALFIAAGSYHHHIGLNTWHSRGAKPVPLNAYGLAEYKVRLPIAAAREHVLGQLDLTNYPYQKGADDPLVLDPSGNGIRFSI